MDKFEGIYRGMLSLDILQLLILRPGGRRARFRTSGVAGTAAGGRRRSGTTRGSTAAACWRFTRGTAGGSGNRDARIVTSDRIVDIPPIILPPMKSPPRVPRRIPAR